MHSVIAACSTVIAGMHSVTADLLAVIAGVHSVTADLLAVIAGVHSVTADLLDSHRRHAFGDRRRLGGHRLRGGGGFAECYAQAVNVMTQIRPAPEKGQVRG